MNMIKVSLNIMIFTTTRFVSNILWANFFQSSHCGGVVSRNKPPSNTHTQDVKMLLLGL
jgi:hypothetical protein